MSALADQIGLSVRKFPNPLFTPCTASCLQGREIAGAGKKPMTPQELANKRLAEFQAARDTGRAAGDFNRGADDQSKDQNRDEGRSH